MISTQKMTAARAASVISFMTLSQQVAGSSTDGSLDVVGGITWNGSLSCHQCIRGGHVFVYEDLASGQLYKGIPRGSSSTGFCC